MEEHRNVAWVTLNIDQFTVLMNGGTLEDVEDRDGDPLTIDGSWFSADELNMIRSGYPQQLACPDFDLELTVVGFND